MIERWHVSPHRRNKVFAPQYARLSTPITPISLAKATKAVMPIINKINLFQRLRYAFNDTGYQFSPWRAVIKWYYDAVILYML